MLNFFLQLPEWTYLSRKILFRSIQFPRLTKYNPWGHFEWTLFVNYAKVPLGDATLDLHPTRYATTFGGQDLFMVSHFLPARISQLIPATAKIPKQSSIQALSWLNFTTKTCQPISQCFHRDKDTQVLGLLFCFEPSNSGPGLLCSFLMDRVSLSSTSSSSSSTSSSSWSRHR